MKISFHIDDHADASELATLRTILGLLEGEPTATIEADDVPVPAKPKPAAKPVAKPVAAKRAAPVEEVDETPADDADTPAEDPADETPAADELDAGVLIKIKEAARKVMATKGPEATKKVLTSFKVERITELRPDQAQAAIKAFQKAAV